MEKRKLLLAEDDELLASLLNFRLQKGGYDVSLSTDGREVKEYLSKTIPDIIVSDIFYPNQLALRSYWYELNDN